MIVDLIDYLIYMDLVFVTFYMSRINDVIIFFLEQHILT